MNRRLKDIPVPAGYYYCPGSGRIKAHRVTLIERIEMQIRRIRKYFREVI